MTVFPHIEPISEENRLLVLVHAEILHFTKMNALFSTKNFS